MFFGKVLMNSLKANIFIHRKWEKFNSKKRRKKINSVCYGCNRIPFSILNQNKVLEFFINFCFQHSKCHWHPQRIRNQSKISSLILIMIKKRRRRWFEVYLSTLWIIIFCKYHWHVFLVFVSNLKYISQITTSFN